MVPASQKDPEGWGLADKFMVVLETAGLNTTAALNMPNGKPPIAYELMPASAPYLYLRRYEIAYSRGDGKDTVPKGKKSTVDAPNGFKARDAHVDPARTDSATIDDVGAICK